MNKLPLTLCLVAMACNAPLDSNPDPNPNLDDESTTGAALTFTTTVEAETSLNTSASPLFTDRYQPAIRFSGGDVPVSNGDMPPTRGHVSKLSIRSLLYPGAKTKIFAETQGWFCSNGDSPIPTLAPADQCGGHIVNGNASNFDSYVKREIDDMQSRGVDGIIADWQGDSAGMGVLNAHTTEAAALSAATLTLVMQEAEARGNFEFAAMEDEGVKKCAKTDGCDVADVVINDLNFLAAHYYSSSAYYRIGGRPVVFFFGVDYSAGLYGKKVDWDRVRATVNGNPLFIFENAGGFKHGQSDGAYSWMSTPKYADFAGSSDPYLLKKWFPDFYKAGAENPTRHMFSSAFKGFDDNLTNGWGKGRRYIAQQCGLTFLDQLADIASRFSTTKPLEGLQLPTWDDYEEGTELETGIDNHLVVEPSLSGTTLSWTVGADATAPKECAGLDLSRTVNHFTVFASTDGSHLAPIADDLAPTTRSVNLAGKLPAGKYQLFVRAMGQPSIRDTLSAPVDITAPGSATSSGTITSPAEGAALTTSVHVVASATAQVHISQVQLWADGVKYGHYDGASVDTVLVMPVGAHALTFVVLDSNYAVIGKFQRNFTVR